MPSEDHMLGRGKWSQPGVPHKGWTCVGVEDLEENLMICEMCETVEIRYAHEMTHPEYGTLECGCICASHMEEGYAAREAEKALRNRASAKSRWLLRKWKESSKGNSWLKTRDQFHVVIWERISGWGGKITDLDYAQEVTSKRRYRSEDEAKMAAWRAIEVMKQRRSRLRKRLRVDEYGNYY